MEDKDHFCSACGYRAYRVDPVVEPEEISQHSSRLACAAAYIGGLFWMPLIVCPDREDAKYHANQGLWNLILTMAACWGMNLVTQMRVALGIGVVSAFASALLSLVYMLLLGFVLYLGVKILQNILAIFRDEKPRPILFFEDMRIIR